MKKQQLKAQNTKNKILQAASELFSQKDFNEVSVADISERAESSIGAFYGHFKSKEALATRLWIDLTISTIKESVEKGSRIEDREKFIDYLIERSIEFSMHPLNTLYRHCRIDEEGYREVSVYAARYLSMIRNMLYAYAPDVPEDTLWTYASIIHNLLNAHAQQAVDVNAYFHFDNDVVRRTILALMNMCKNERDNCSGD